jgi:glutaredoxin
MPEVTIFTRTTCAPCKTVKYFLQKKGVAFVEKNVDEPENAAEFAKVSDFPMVPLVLVGDQKVQGMNLSLLSNLLMV